jgi:hypothetical protein
MIQQVNKIGSSLRFENREIFETLVPKINQKMLEYDIFDLLIQYLGTLTNLDTSRREFIYYRLIVSILKDFCFNDQEKFSLSQARDFFLNMSSGLNSLSRFSNEKEYKDFRGILRSFPPNFETLYERVIEMLEDMQTQQYLKVPQIVDETFKSFPSTQNIGVLAFRIEKLANELTEQI